MSIVQQLAVASTPLLNKGDIQNLPTDTPATLLANGLHIAYWAGGIIAVIIIIVAGFMYATSAGDSKRTTQAKDAILYSVIGLVVIALAFVITQFVTGSF